MSRHYTAETTDDIRHIADIMTVVSVQPCAASVKEVLTVFTIRKTWSDLRKIRNFRYDLKKKDSPKKAEFVAMDMSQFKVGTRFLFCQKKREKKGDRLVLCEVKQVKPNGIIVTLEPTEEGQEIKYPERTFNVVDMNRFRGFVNEG